MPAPLALFVYKRPWHTEQTLRALAQNDLAKDTELYVFADGAKADASAQDLADIEAVRKLLRQNWPFRALHRIEREKNWGLADNIVDGVTWLCKEQGRIIVLEDDVLTAKGFLRFMNEGLDLYAQEEQVMSIAAHLFDTPEERQLPPSFFLSIAHCWGWATWQRAWQDFESDATILLQRIKRESSLKAFEFHPHYNFIGQLLANAEKKRKTWAVKWQALHHLKKGLVLHPQRALVRNIGLDGSGENCENKGQEQQVQPPQIELPPLEAVPLVLSTDIEALYQQAHPLPPEPSFFQRIKRRVLALFSKD